MTQIADFREFTPETDPVNRAPREPRGYPVRIHSDQGRIAYVDSDMRREVIVNADAGLIELQEMQNWPWWRKIWHRMFGPS
ncbi:hypothetical protein [Nesterenkonia alba]|uniref:hypothetical protein n=1 Tax=Nesterenkonia alba TaxID=515814 RepID=UPI0012ECA5A5|nr:hypothetical protein [Nesterenkonia alba]